MPVLALRSASHVAPFVLVEVWLMSSGVYIWEFITTLDYEWSVIRGHQPYRWTIWIYSIMRLSCLLLVIQCLVNFSISTKINCQAWNTIGWIAGALGGYGLASILIILRIYAIWNGNKVIMAMTAVVWVGNMGAQLSGIIRTRSVWVPAARACVNVTTNPELTKELSLATLVTDFTLLFIMLAGLLRLRNRDRDFFHLEYVLWKQGVMLLVISTAAGFPLTVTQYVKADGIFKNLFGQPSLIAMVISASQMYRSLTHYGSTPPSSVPGPIEPDSINLSRINRVVPGTKGPSIVDVPSDQLTVHKANEEHPMSRMNSRGSYPNSDAQIAEPPQ